MDSPKGFGLHPTAPGESEPQEKLSVYKRAKAKARKIRDSISSKTHSGQSHDDHAADHDEEDELLSEPEAHASPSPTAMHMSPTAENIKASYGSKSYMGENPEDKVTEADIPMPAALVPGQELGTSQHVATDDNVNSGRSNASLGEQLVEEPQYQAKVTDPGTGGHEAEFSPIQHSFEKMGIYDKPQHKEDSTTPPPPSTGSDQFSPSSDPLSNKPSTIPENNQYVPESYNAAVGDHPQDMNVDELPKQQSGYTDKTSSVLTEPDISMPAEPKHELEYPSNVATDHHDINSGRSNNSFGDQFGEHLGEDPNYQAKVTDAGTGIDHEVGVAPTVHSFDKMGTYDEPQHKEDSATPLPPTGSRDQFLPSSELLSSKSNTISDNAESLPESYDATTVNHPQDMNVDEPPKQQSDYTEEPSSVSSGISNEALTATSVGASKIGSGGIDDTKEGENVPSDGLPIDSTNPADDTAEPSTIPQDTQSVRESYDAAPVDHEDKKGIYDEPESTAPPPPMTTGSDDQFSPSSDLSSNKPSTIPQDTQSVRENYDADVVDHPQDITDASVDHPQDMSVDEPPKQQSGNTDDTSSVFSAVPDKAITSAKNVAASEIGHGGTDESKGENVSSDGMPIDSTDPAVETNSEASKLGYGESESPAGVETNSEASKFGYGESENPAGVETNSEASKLGYGGGESPAGVETNSDINKNVVDKSSETGEGSPSGGMKGYLAEKLKPGEDDRALSKLITGKEDKKNTDEEISNAFHNRNNDEDTQKQDKPVGEVTKSEEEEKDKPVGEVTKSEEEEKSGKALGDESPSPGMVGKLKGWFGYGGETSPSKASNDHTPSHGAESVSSEGEKKA